MSGSFDALALSGFLGSLDSRTQNTDVLLQCDEELGVQNFAFEGTFMSLREQFCYVCSPVAQRPIDWCFVAVICCMGYCTSTQHFAYFHVAKPRRKMKRRRSVPSSCHGTRPFAKQEDHTLCMTAICCNQEWSHVVPYVPVAHIGS